MSSTQIYKVTDCQSMILSKSDSENRFRVTPFIMTLNVGQRLTPIDIRNFIETGTRIVRLKMNLVLDSERQKLLRMLKDSIKDCCEKFEVSHWPIAVCLDVPNGCIRTGCLSESNVNEIFLKDGEIVELTCDIKYWNRCEKSRIFIDDPYTFPLIVPGTEVTIRFGRIVMICKDVIDKKTNKCQIVRAGGLRDNEFVHIRGVRHMRPTFSKNDMSYLHFALESDVDVIILNTSRNPDTIDKIRQFFMNANRPVPLVAAAICEQEGLDNMDTIIEEADIVILAREFLAYALINKHSLTTVQLQISAKCKKAGTPLYISGSVLENTLLNGNITSCDLSDLTNIVMQGAGFLMRNYSSASNVLLATTILDDLCKTTEMFQGPEDFWSIAMEHIKPPVNAANACILSCALLIKQSQSKIVIVPTVTGKTAMYLTRLIPQALIIAVTVQPGVARKLLLYRGILPLIYDKTPQKNWYEDMQARVDFAIMYAMRYDLIVYGEPYVLLKKCAVTSSFCDHVSVWNVNI